MPASTTQLAELSSELPGLHAAALQLLSLVWQLGRCSVLPLQASACRLLQEWLRRVAVGSSRVPAALRRALHTTVAQVVRRGGLGAGRAVAADAAAAITAELYGAATGTGSSGGGRAAGSLSGPKAKKAKLQHGGQGQGQGPKGGRDALGLDAAAAAAAMATAGALAAGLPTADDVQAQVMLKRGACLPVCLPRDRSVYERQRPWGAMPWSYTHTPAAPTPLRWGDRHTAVPFSHALLIP